jgi:hypothetical protein
MDGVRAMYRACIQRAMHDACGATVVAPTQVQQMKFAKQAWNFLYSNDKENRDERWFVCMLAGVDPEALEARMAVAAIPTPTYETLRNAWTQLELAYWRLGGQKGDKPEARPENSKPATRGDTNARVAKGHRINKRNPGATAATPASRLCRAAAARCCSGPPRRPGPAEVRRHYGALFGMAAASVNSNSPSDRGRAQCSPSKFCTSSRPTRNAGRRPRCGIIARAPDLCRAHDVS